ncbi:hypothetical protein C1645_786709 [Glomus cerebriforme]|uniref:Uncharacterized protein n=1 Tax=Glomus cerebriforme TaxID=658196 RepID=A0A397SGF3_9GLOM|nr:hypothetical protein C1645_786709 [Glomus cerebriforme]
MSINYESTCTSQSIAAETINRISNLPMPQLTNNILVDNFYNGTNFVGNNDYNSNIESLLLPSGSFSPTSFN